MNNKDTFFLRKLIDLLSVCLYWKDADFRYLGCNIAQAKSLGYASAKEMLGKTDDQLAPKLIADKLYKTDLRVAKLGTPIEVEETRITKSGEKLTFLSRKVPLFDEKKVFKGIVSISVNITELSQALEPSKTQKIKLRVKSNKHKKAPILAKILLVEDAPLAQKMTSTLFINLHCSVDITSTVKSALKNFKQTNYDLIVADLSLHDGSGIALARAIRLHEKRHKLKATPLIGLTAHASESIKKMCLKAQFDELLTKPLLKKQAENLLTTYINDYILTAPSHGLLSSSPITDEIIDISHLDQITEDGSVDPLTTIFPMMVEALNIEKPKLQSAYLKKNWSAVQFLVHKLRGSAAYCAAKRLEKACEQLENYFEAHQNPDKKELDTLYQRLLIEVKILQQKLVGLQAQNE